LFNWAICALSWKYLFFLPAREFLVIFQYPSHKNSVE
jgi:hypothetical protein